MRGRCGRAADPPSSTIFVTRSSEAAARVHKDVHDVLSDVGFLSGRQLVH